MITEEVRKIIKNHNTHDHNLKGECLVIEWGGAAEEKEGYEKQEALTQQQIDVKKEEIRQINFANKQISQKELLKENKHKFK